MTREIDVIFARARAFSSSLGIICAAKEKSEFPGPYVNVNFAAEFCFFIGKIMMRFSFYSLEIARELERYFDGNRPRLPFNSLVRTTSLIIPTAKHF